MNGKDFEAELHALVGNDRGWKVKAAELLGTTRPTLDAALSRGPSDALLSKLDAASLGVTDVQEDETLSNVQWFIGEPENKLRDSKVLGEVIVSHIGFPAFMLHATLRSGKTEAGQADIEYKARWIDKPSSRERKTGLLEQAKRRAHDRLHASASAYAERELRGRLERAAMTASGLSSDDVAAMTDAGLQVARYASQTEGLEQAYRDIGRQHNELRNERMNMTPECRRAFDAGVKCGRIDQQERIYVSAWAHSGAEVTQAFAAQPYRHLPFARKDSSRGDDIDAQRDFEDMLNVDWGDE